jgi:endonuclease/exonuclease/phosphatase (EEP) superfamily protein YafD
MRRWIAIAVVVPWVAWAVARTFGLDRVHPLIAFAAFTPYAALTAVVPVVVALVLRRWGAALVAAAAAVVLAVAVVPRGLGTSGALPSGADAVTVMAFNTYGGAGDAERVVELVRRHDVDVLLLEELTNAGLADLDRAGIDVSLRHREVRPRDDGLGNGILSRHPLRPVPDWSRPTEPAVDVDLRGRPLRVRVVHPLPPVGGDQTQDWRAYLRGLPSAPPGAAVLAGDFNATLDHRDFRRLLDRGWTDAAADVGMGLKPTWPVGRRILGLTIDHVLVSGRLTVGEVRVEEIPDSDHRAVIARLGVPR